MKILKIDDIPVIHLQESLYFIGIFKLHVVLKGDFLLVKIGSNNFERLADYIKENRDNFKTQLTLISIKNEKLPIIQVIDRIVRK